MDSAVRLPSCRHGAALASSLAWVGLVLTGRYHMNSETLLEMLVEIEWALQRTNYGVARALVMQAEDYVLQSEREMIHLQGEKVRQAA